MSQFLWNTRHSATTRSSTKIRNNWGFPCNSVGKESTYNAGDPGSIPGLGRSSGERNGNPLQDSCPENPMDCGLPGSSVHGILQARRLEWVAIPFPRGSSQPRDWTQVSHIAGRFFTIWATMEAPSKTLSFQHEINTRMVAIHYTPLCTPRLWNRVCVLQL